jgi:hypothetical protein
MVSGNLLQVWNDESRPEPRTPSCRTRSLPPTASRECLRNGGTPCSLLPCRSKKRAICGINVGILSPPIATIEYEDRGIFHVDGRILQRC